MSNHTPGPWSNDYGVEIRAGEFRPICGMRFPFDSEQNQANARLIAAAPELLEALEKIAQINPYDTSSMGYVVGLARAAIAKATGVGL